MNILKKQYRAIHYLLFYYLWIFYTYYNIHYGREDIKCDFTPVLTFPVAFVLFIVGLIRFLFKLVTSDEENKKTYIIYLIMLFCPILLALLFS